MLPALARDGLFGRGVEHREHCLFGSALSSRESFMLYSKIHKIFLPMSETFLMFARLVFMEQSQMSLRLTTSYEPRRTETEMCVDIERRSGKRPHHTAYERN